MTIAAGGSAERRCGFEIANASPSLSERQAEFAAALLDPRRSTPPGLVGPDGRPSTRWAEFWLRLVGGPTGWSGGLRLGFLGPWAFGFEDPRF
jgi:hypothetical protein